jgi:hypothetical protein
MGGVAHKTRELQSGFFLKSRAAPGNECITISVVYICNARGACDVYVANLDQGS